MGNDLLKMATGILLVSLFLLYSGYLYVSIPNGQDMSILEPGSERGKLLWQEKNCVACHQVYGLGGYLGPDITNVYSLKGPAYIRAFLAKGTVIMPDFNLSEKEMDDLVAYLKSIDASGKSDPRTFLIHMDGTISQ